MILLAKNIFLNAILKKNVMIITYSFSQLCSDDRNFLYESLLETMEKYKLNFKLEFNNSKNVGVEIITNNNNMEAARLRLFRIKANSDLRQYTDKYN